MLVSTSVVGILRTVRRFNLLSVSFSFLLLFFCLFFWTCLCGDSSNCTMCLLYYYSGKAYFQEVKRMYSWVKKGKPTQKFTVSNSLQLLCFYNFIVKGILRSQKYNFSHFSYEPAVPNPVYRWILARMFGCTIFWMLCFQIFFSSILNNKNYESLRNQINVSYFRYKSDQCT
jgi:hypothetical protein